METINQIFVYFFQPNPPRSFQYSTLLWVIVAALFIAAAYIITQIRRNREDKPFRKLFRSYPSKLITIGVLLSFYLLSRSNAIPFFAMRFMLFILLAVGAYVVYTGVNTYLKKYPQEKKVRNQRQEINKYIPRKKKK